MGLNILALTFLFAQIISANVEKTIFLGPEPAIIPSQHPTLADLALDALTPSNWSLRTTLPSSFPTDVYPRGRPIWLLLDALSHGQRYEVRICWAATVKLPNHVGNVAFHIP